jgi:hypothetical protein
VITNQQRCPQPGASERRIEPPSPGALFESGLYIPFNEVPLGTTGGAWVLANGNLAMSWVESSFEGSVDANDVPGPARACVGLNGAVTIEFALEAGADVSDSLRLALVGLPPFTIEPVTVSPFVQVKLDFAATAEAAGRVSVVAPFHIASGFSFDGVSRAGLSSPPRFQPEVGLPGVEGVVAASVEVEVVLALMMSIGDVPLGGPVLGPSLGLLLEVDALAGWDLDGLVEILGGWAFPDPLDPAVPQIPEDLETLFAPPASTSPARRARS